MILYQLYLRKHYQKQLLDLSMDNLDDPNMLKPDVNAADKALHKLIQCMLRELQVQHVKPQEIIITQSEAIRDADGEYHENAYFYIIINGDFKVKNLKFIQQHKRNKTRSKVGLSNSNKVLQKGDFFGELAFILNTRRSSTVKALYYSSLACVTSDTFESMMVEFPQFQKYLTKDVIRYYDDDLKLFLVEALRKVDYMSHLQDEILAHLAYTFQGEKVETDSFLFNPESEENLLKNDEMAIIFEGQVEIYIELDSGQKFTIDYLSRGSVINPHAMLTERPYLICARTCKPTTYYSLCFNSLVEIGSQYPLLARKLIRERGKSETQRVRANHPLDYFSGSPTFVDVHGIEHQDETKDRMIKALFALKNSSVNLLLKNRRDTKLHNLKQILQEFISHKNRQKE